MFKDKTIVPEDFQLVIAKKFIESEYNFALVQETGTGKTVIAIMIAIYFLVKKKKKVLFLAPTKILAEQHYKKIIEWTKLNPEIVILMQNKREKLWQQGWFFVSTPQGVWNDIRKGLVDLNQFGLIIFDEMHIAANSYDYIKIANVARSKKIRTLGMTATIGCSFEKIQDSLKILNLKDIVNFNSEIPEQKSLEKYLHEKTQMDYFIDLEDFIVQAEKTIKIKLDDILLKFVKNGFCSLQNKILSIKQLKVIGRRIKQKKYFHYLLAQYYKLRHLLSLIICENYFAAYQYYLELTLDNSKSSEFITADKSLQRLWRDLLLKNQAFEQFSPSRDLIFDHEMHPKLVALLSFVNSLANFQSHLILIFCNDKTSQQGIFLALEKFKELQGKSRLIYRAETQEMADQNARLLAEFDSGEFNVLISTQLLEAGIHLQNLDTVINYSLPADEKKTKQRAGRVGRTKPGCVFNLIMKHVFDSSLFYGNLNKAKASEETLRLEKKARDLGMESLILARQLSLL